MMYNNILYFNTADAVNGFFQFFFFAKRDTYDTHIDFEIKFCVTVSIVWCVTAATDRATTTFSHFIPVGLCFKIHSNNNNNNNLI
jgi:hypothetical protein